MCGRFSQTFSSKDIRDYFNLTAGEGAAALMPQFNIAPSQEVVAIRVEKGHRILVQLRWGLIPFWAKDRKIAYRTFNARAETAHKTPAFRAAFGSRRCLIPASGFFEWDKKSGTKQPYFIHRVDKRPMAFAGLWEYWEGQEDGDIIESCTILTTEAAEPVAKLHDRMPVILESENFDLWLNPQERQIEHLRDLLQSAELGIITMYPVTRYVNKAGNEGARCIEPLEMES